MGLSNKKNLTNTGIKNIEKREYKGRMNYTYIKGKNRTSMSNLDFLLKHLEADGEPIIIQDEDLFNQSILESRKNRYQDHCEFIGMFWDKDPDSFCELYSEWLLPDGKWGIINFDGSERFTVRRKDKESVLKLVDDLNNGRPYPYKIIKNDYSRKYGVGIGIKKE